MALEIIIQNEFEETKLDVDLGLLYIFYTEKTDDMTEEDLKKNAIAYRNKLIELENLGKIKENNLSFLVDLRQMKFSIAPNLQTWLDDNISSKISHLHYKTALLLPKDIFANAGIEQYYEENSNKILDTRSFDDRQEALNWLLG